MEIDKILGILNQNFIDDFCEVTLISKEITLRETRKISKVEVKGDSLFLITNKKSQISITFSTLIYCYHYGPGSLAFLFKDGATLTLRHKDQL